MRYFSLLDLQYVVLLILLGVTAVLILYVAFGNYAFTPEKKEEPKRLDDHPDGIQVRDRPIPPILIFVYVGFVIWAVAYVIMIGIRGRPF